MNSFYAFNAQSIQGENLAMSQYAGKVVLVVNTASECGYTPQYAGLQDLHIRYKDEGLVILGFPCNQFGGQEPGTAESIQRECLADYGVSFQMFDKIRVNGEQAHPLYVYLKKELPGVLGQPIRWNFTKFLLDGKGIPIKRFGSNTTPGRIEKHIKSLLSQRSSDIQA